MTVREDLRYGLRMLLKKPGFAIIAITTLALGIGANTIVFSGVYALFLQDLPYPNAGRLVVVTQSSRSGVETFVSYADFRDWQRQSETFEEMAASRTVSMNLTGSELAERVTTSYVTRELLPMMGARVSLGRGFAEEDFRPGAAKTIVVSHDFWRGRLGGDMAILGKHLKLNGEDFTVLGVMAEEYRYPFRAHFWAPLESTERNDLLYDRDANLYEITGRLKSHVAAGDALKELAALAQGSNMRARAITDLAIKVTPLAETLPGIEKYRDPVIVMQLAVLFVLLIASANLANMLLARNSRRRQEFTLRLALGASRARLVRQLLVEGLLTGFAGSALGLLIAAWGLGWLRSVIAWRAPGAREVELNPVVLLVTLGASLLTTLAFSLMPALIASKQNLSEGLKSAAYSVTAARARRGYSKALVAAEVSLAVMLLAGAGLMIRTFINLTNEDPGFDPNNGVALTIALPPSGYAGHDQLSAFYGEAIRRIKSLPGVEDAGAVTYMPLVGYNPGADFRIEGRAVVEEMKADYQPVSAGYFRAIGIPVLRGETFAERDMSASPQKVIINAALERRFFNGEDALGKHIQVSSANKEPASLVVVGVVGDVRQFGLHNEPRPEIYLPTYRNSMSLIVRGGEAERLIPALAEVIRGMGDDRVVYNLKTLPQLVADSIEKRRIFMLLVSVLSTIALLMSVMGIYGVISYGVAERTREFGIRMALGANSARISLSVVKQALALALAGLAIGSAGSLALARLMRSLLYGVGPFDPLMLIAPALLILIAATAASFIPARRAATVDPMIALRHE
jgi:putative ABC transport system permease protein